MIETPGHTTDSLCFVLVENGKNRVVFSGDHIIGSNSTSYSDYPTYLESLYKVRSLNSDYLCMAHSLEFEKESIMVDSKVKVNEYISKQEESN